MFPLTNTEILAPLIVGFALERVALHSLASQYEKMVATFHQQGMSEAEIAEKLCAITNSGNTKVITLRSTEVYNEPAEATDTISTWKNAENTPSARNQLLQVCRFMSLRSLGKWTLSASDASS